MTKTNKIVTTILFACALAFILCAQTSCKNESTNTDSMSTIEDIYKREVKYPKNIERVATVGSATRICVYAGATDKLCAITESDSENILRPYTIAYKDKFSNIQTTNNGNHINETNIDKEKLLSLNPDVIFSTRSKDECTKLQNEINIPVIGVYFQDEMFSEEVYRSIETIGIVCNTEKHSQSTIEYLKNFELELKNLNTDNKTPIYRGAVNFKGSKGLTGTISNYCIYKTLGINNVADRSDINSCYDTNIEQIVTWNPKYVFLDCTNANKITTDWQNNSSILTKISAFSDNNVYYVAPFNSNGTNIEYGLCEAFYTAHILNPQKIDKSNLQTKFREIFIKLDGSDIYDEINANGIKFEKAKF